MSPKIIQGDALKLLNGEKNAGAIITSLPDAEEIGGAFNDWVEWFDRATKACLAATSREAITIFYQTDRKRGGGTYSKAHAIMRTAEEAGHRLLWHKIALRRQPGRTDPYRPAYTHMIAFTRDGGATRPTPDVIDGGKPLYRNGTGWQAARFMAGIARDYSDTATDPFCGQGTIVVAAIAEGMEATGIDIDPDQVHKARALLTRSAE